MTIPPHPARAGELAWGALLLLACLFTYIAYAQGFGANWTFDDVRVLERLVEVGKTQSTMEFIFHDSAVGPLRRPLAMASFLLNQGDWPLQPQQFRHLNTLIHILNGLLLALVALRVARAVPRLAPRAEGFAVTLVTAWMLHPFLASTSLMVIQRMTLLSATFSLLGALAYLRGREDLTTRPLRAYLLMSGGLMGGSMLGVLAKESAALTPLLVGVLEFTVLSVYAPVKQGLLANWRRIFFGLPVLGLALYTAYYLTAHASGAYAIRPFTLSERLWSESIILFEYARQLFIPDITAMGPYQDDISRIVGMRLASLVATAAWVGLIAAALWLRRRHPALSFAVLFFLAGHLLESTLFPLELYFEHRNYLPSLGPLGALVGLAWAAKPRWAGIIPILFALIMAAMLWKTTTLWASPVNSARAWLAAHPTSTRAAFNWANQHLYRGDRQTYAEIIVEQYRLKPRDGALALTAELVQCFLTQPDEHASITANVIKDASILYNASNTPLTLHRIIDLQLTHQCNAFNGNGVLGIANGLLSNPLFLAKGIGRYDLFMAIARIHDLAGDHPQALEARLAAFKMHPHIVAAEGIVSGLSSSGRTTEARTFLNEARQKLPEQRARLDALAKDLPPPKPTDSAPTKH